MKRDVLDRQQKFPERLRHVGIFAPRRQQKINREHDEIGRHDAQRAASEEAFEINRLIARKRREQLPADQITAQDKEKIDTDPAPAMKTSRRAKAHDAGVVNNHHDDGERAEKIETRLTFAVLKTGIDGYRRQWRVTSDG